MNHSYKPELYNICVLM